MSDHQIILDQIADLKADLKSDLGELLTQARETNGRLRKAEMHVAVLRWAVFGGGTGMLGALGYLVQMHLK
jgi:hypothetical protein